MRSLSALWKINYGSRGKNERKETTQEAVIQVQAGDDGGLDEVEAVNMENGEWAQRSGGETMGRTKNASQISDVNS